MKIEKVLEQAKSWTKAVCDPCQTHTASGATTLPRMPGEPLPAGPRFLPTMPCSRNADDHLGGVED